LHLHTTFSDGTSSPADLVRQAQEAGLAAIAVTDHDCIGGIPEAVAAAGNALEVIPGVELTVAHREVELHVLGLCMDPAAAHLPERFARMRAARELRIQQMILRLEAHGVSVSWEEVLQVSGLGVPGRPHLARVLVQRGYVATPEEAFDRYLGDRSPCFVKGATLTPATAVEFIRSAGGVSVLAHPARFVPDAWLPELVAAGIQGVEAYHPDHGAAVARRYRRYAREQGLLVTGGSDAHGTWKANGAVVGSVTVPYSCVEELKDAARRVRALAVRP